MVLIFCGNPIGAGTITLKLIVEEVHRIKIKTSNEILIKRFMVS
jgi:hypothetical protein